MKGLKTFLFGMAVVGLGIMESAGFTHLVAEYPGTFSSVVGVLIVVFRWITTSPIFSDK